MKKFTSDGTLLGGNPINTLAQYLARGGGSGLAAARKLGPVLAIRERRLSGLRGRGGAGLPTAKKWASVRTAAEPADHAYAGCNGAEGEPGTFKDRAIFRHNPSRRSAWAQPRPSRVKKTFHREIAGIGRALQAMTEAGRAGDVPITVVAGADSYLFGDEKGLVEVIEARTRSTLRAPTPGRPRAPTLRARPQESRVRCPE